MQGSAVKSDQDPEPDARSVVNRVLVAATAMLLTAEMLLATAIIALLIERIQQR